MKTENLMLLTYYALGGKIEGKTKLQKTFYFLSVILDKDLGYDAHYYGPYSANVAEINTDLTTYGYLNETSNHWGLYSGGFEVIRYDYQLTEEANEIIKIKKEKNPEDWNKIKDAVELIKSSGDIHYMVLSVAAKAHFILKNEVGRVSFEKIKEMAGNFGWQVSDEELTEAKEFLLAAKLVE